MMIISNKQKQEQMNEEEINGKEGYVGFTPTPHERPRQSRMSRQRNNQFLTIVIYISTRMISHRIRGKTNIVSRSTTLVGTKSKQGQPGDV